MKWLKDNFSYIDNCASAIERQKYALNEGLLMSNKSRNLVALTTSRLKRSGAIQLGINYVSVIVPRYVSGIENIKN
ncbi:hypothetical protein EPI10_027542 [Gossypium australe]|uniref:Uncharacterized protein n=1 Tax=Gossypium australe TaxID=47621 RepID=A0A5B6UTX7_9ROSI|nr:hypothetical protein EPI10_027542 [Gossypium australe]